MQLSPGALHGTGVSCAERGVLILGRSGAGKSSLALHLIQLGASLISDDRVILKVSRQLTLQRPSEAPALIEARGVGLLNAPYVDSSPLALVVDLDCEESDRLPRLKHAHCAGFSVPLFHNVTNSTFPIAIWQYLLHGRSNPDG